MRDDQDYLPPLLDRVLTQLMKPYEVIIVDSSRYKLENVNEITGIFLKAGIKFIYIHSEPIYPGAARNLGIQQSTLRLIAFLDVKTLPPFNWLENTYKQLENKNTYGVLGSTVYQAETDDEKIFRAATYGVNPIATIPGSLFKIEAFSVVGLFLSNTVAGEDSDWILRARLHGITLTYRNRTDLLYTGLINIKFSKLIRKWWRNYRACRNIPYLADHKSIYLLVLNIIILYIALHWNGVIANWDESNHLYIRHITKIGIIITITLYIYYRCFHLPIRRGVSIFYLFKWNWFKLFLIAVTIDFVKLVAFLPSIKNIKNRLRYAWFRE